MEELDTYEDRHTIFIQAEDLEKNASTVHIGIKNAGQPVYKY